jgi:hypothetical protein
MLKYAIVDVSLTALKDHSKLQSESGNSATQNLGDSINFVIYRNILFGTKKRYKIYNLSHFHIF